MANLEGLLTRFYNLLLDIIQGGYADRFANYYYEIIDNTDSELYHYIIPSDRYGQFSYARQLLNKNAVTSNYVYGVLMPILGHNFEDIKFETVWKDYPDDIYTVLNNIKEILMGLKDFRYEFIKADLRPGYLIYVFGRQLYIATIHNNEVIKGSVDTIADGQIVHDKSWKDVVSYNRDIMIKRLNYILNLEKFIMDALKSLVMENK